MWTAFKNYWKHNPFYGATGVILIIFVILIDFDVFTSVKTTTVYDAQIVKTNLTGRTKDGSSRYNIPLGEIDYVGPKGNKTYVYTPNETKIPNIKKGSTVKVYKSSRGGYYLNKHNAENNANLNTMVKILPTVGFGLIAFFIFTL